MRSIEPGTHNPNYSGLELRLRQSCSWVPDCASRIREWVIGAGIRDVTARLLYEAPAYEFSALLRRHRHRWRPCRLRGRGGGGAYGRAHAAVDPQARNHWRDELQPGH